MSSSMTGFFIAFVLYLGVMILVGVKDMKHQNTTDDYFLGGRSLNAWVAAFSAQASDMSGWLLMGLPGAVYALGTGQIWIAVGLFIGTVLNWLFVATRLRRYTIRANNSITLPRYFENRFHDGTRVLLLVSSVAILIFFLVYTASAFASSGKLFTAVFGLDYHIALTIGMAVILIYTLLGGFDAVCDTDFIQGTIMVIALVAVPLAGIMLTGDVGASIAASTGPDSHFLDPMYSGGERISAVSIISQLAWGLGYCGMPHIIVRFMAVKSEQELNKAKIIAIIWDIISLVFAILIGVVGRACLADDLTATGDQEKVFIRMIIQIFTQDIRVPIIGGLFLCGILAAIMSTADSQLLITASSVTEDIYIGFFRKKPDDRSAIRISRVTVLCVAVAAYFIAWNPDSSIMGLVSDAWAGLGASFGPTVLMSLYWKRTNRQGAVAGIASGAATVIFWDYIRCFGGKTAGEVTGLYSLAVGFAVSLLFIFAVSLATPAPDQEMQKEFEEVNTAA
ncbi:MAG: sodium/proline symporter PutP [Lachnospiraceae bacterium]|jgi:sodium/proline symporter|nr:sodium/proline symporter PutP [Lachnospiraceae bacterium]